MKARLTFALPLCAVAVLAASLPARAATVAGLDFRGEKTFRYEGTLGPAADAAATRGGALDQELRFILSGEPVPGVTTRIDYDDAERERFRALRFDAERGAVRARLGDLEGPLTPFRLFRGDPGILRGARIAEAEEGRHALFLAAGVGRARTERFLLDAREGAYFLPDRELLAGSVRVTAGGRELSPNAEYVVDLEAGLLTFVEEPPPGTECRVDYRVRAETATAADYAVGVTGGFDLGGAGFDLVVVGTPGGGEAPVVGAAERLRLGRRGDFRLECLAVPGEEGVGGVVGYALGWEVAGGRRVTLEGKRGGSPAIPAPLSLADDFRRLSLPGPRIAGLDATAALMEEAGRRAFDLALGRAGRAPLLGLRREETPGEPRAGVTRSDLRFERVDGAFRTETRMSASLPDDAAEGAGLGSIDVATQGRIGDVATRVELGRRETGNAESMSGRLKARRRLSGRTTVATEVGGRLDGAGAASVAETRAGASLERAVSRRLKTTADVAATTFRRGLAGERTKGYTDLSLGWRLTPRPRVEILQALAARRGSDDALGEPIRRDECRLSLRLEPVARVELAAGGSVALVPGDAGSRRLDGEVAWRFRDDAKMRLFASREENATLGRGGRGLDVTAALPGALEAALEYREEGLASPLLGNDVVDRRGGFRLTAKL